MTNTRTNLVGTLLDRRYRVEKLLARGGMSSVYRGVDTRLDRAVAIKIMDPRFADDASFVERFEREARSAAKLHHPHVVAVHDQGVDIEGDDHHAFLVMELVDGGTLRDLLEEQGGELDIPLAINVFEPVLAALAAAHDAGLVHRDVKPENVLIGRGGIPGAGVVKVGDFGLVRAVASAGTTSASVILGTVAYLSPEQVTAGSASERGDVYSAGILLYEMLTGTAPYVGDTALSVAYRHVNEDVPAPSRIKPGIPAVLDDLVLRATRRDPAARPANAGAFLEELTRVRDELGVAPVPIPVPPPPDIDRLSDSEVTMPGITSAPGARGTRAFHRIASPHTTSAELPAIPPIHPDNSVPPAPRRRRWIALVAAVVLLGAMIGAGVWWFGGGRYTTIPQVLGLDQATAEKVLRDARLAPRFTKERNNTVQSGTVAHTQPAAGSSVLRDEEIVVVLSLGRPVVPDVAAGTAVDQAETALRTMQLEPRRDSKADKYDPTVPQGAVLALNPAPGTELDIGSQVLLVLSKGAPPTPIPNVIGKSKDEAFQALRTAGYEPVEGGAEFSQAVPGGGVSRIDPAAGTTTNNNGSKRVTVWVSNSITVPSLTGQPVKDALRTLSDLGLQGEAQGRGRSGFSFVVGQDPAAGKLVTKGSTVRLTTFP